MRYFRIIRRSILLVAHIVLGCVLVPFSCERDKMGKLRVRARVFAWWHGCLMRILNFQIVSTGTIPAAPVLLVANHISWVDIPLLGHVAQAHFLSKDDVRHWPVIGWLASSTGTLFIKRGGGQTGEVAAAIKQYLQSDDILAIFPEGTTTDGREVRPFFPRLFSAVVDSEIAIVPVAIRYHVDGEHDLLAPFVGDQSLVENLLGLLSRPVNQVNICFHEPVLHDGESRKALAEKVRNVIVSSLNVMASDQQIQAT